MKIIFVNIKSKLHDNVSESALCSTLFNVSKVKNIFKIVYPPYPRAFTAFTFSHYTE